MKISISSLFLLLTLFSWCQSVDSIKINFVDIKENKQSELIYYVNGKYKIKPQPKYDLKKIKYLGNFSLVNPVSLINQDSVLKITSFRNKFISDKFYEHLNSHNIAALARTIFNNQVYFVANYKDLTTEQKDSLNSVYQLKVDSISYTREDYDSHLQKHVKKNYVKYRLNLLDYDRFEKEAKKHRDSLSSFVNEILTPFYMSRFEVTNAEYRKFVEWVRDSVALKYLYDSLPSEKGVKLLNIPKKEKLNPALKAENLMKYGLNFDLEPFEMQFEDSMISTILSYFYYVQPERYYQRREIDSRTIIYKINDKDLAIYPDTLSFYQGYEDTMLAFYSPKMDMYFWHPGYGNYPVMGLSLEQMKAYCFWLERQMNRVYPSEEFQFKVSLPSSFQYEMAIKSCVPNYMQDEIDVNSPTPFVFKRNDEDVMDFNLSVTFMPENYREKNNEYFYKINEWYKTHSTYPIYNLINNLAEVCIDKDENDASKVCVLGSDLKTVLVAPQEIQLNTLFYKRFFAEDEKLYFTGFRPVLYVVGK